MDLNNNEKQKLKLFFNNWKEVAVTKEDRVRKTNNSILLVDGT